LISLWAPVTGGGEFGLRADESSGNVSPDLGYHRRPPAQWSHVGHCRIRRGARSTDMRELICIALAVPARHRIRPRAPPALAARPQGL